MWETLQVKSKVVKKKIGQEENKGALEKLEES